MSMEGIQIHRNESRRVQRRVQRRPAHTSHVSLLNRVWDAVESDAERRWSALTRQLNADVVSLLRSASALWFTDAESRYQVSATVLRLGVNTPDHTRVFRRLRRAITADLTPHVVCLRAAACTNMRGLMQQLVRRLAPDADLKRLGVSGPLLQSYHAVERWFAREAAGDQALVVLLEDCEAFSPRLLQDFVAISSVHAARLPLLLVFGVASHLGVLHGLLGSVASSRLRLQVVQAPGPGQCRRRVLEPLLLPTRQCPFTVGPRVRAFLLDAFSRLDFSVHNFCQRLRLCLLEHLLSFPVAVIDAFWIALITGDKVKWLSDQEQTLCDILRHMKQQELSRAAAEWLARLLRSSGVSSVDLRTAALAPGGLVKSELFSRAVAQWLKSPAASLANAIEEANEAWAEKEMDKELDELRTEFAKLAEELKGVEEAVQSPVSSPAALGKGKMSLKQLQAGLKALNAQNQRPIDQMRQRLRRCLEARMETLCRDVWSIRGWETMVFDDVEAIRGLVNPTQRADLQIALARPSVYLHGDRAAGQDEATSLDSRLPDLSILYKLHLECPHFINLYDWLQAFNAVLGEKQEADGVPSRTVQARFVLGVSELHFLGFVKATARKTDHVVRLTWGSC